MHQQKELNREEKLQEYEKLKKELLAAYHKHKTDLAYALDDVEEGMIKAKREKLARRIKALSAKIAELSTTEGSV